MQRGLTARLKIVALALLTAASVWAGQTQSPGRSAIRKLRFSPDGRYILAQDASAITVLTVTPLAVLFRIPAEDATDVQFTPDSQRVTFLTGGTRVDAAQIKLANSGATLELWSIANGARMDAHELPSHACATQRLSPDGRILACNDLFGTLWLVDTASGSTILRKEGFSQRGFEFNSPDSGYSRTQPELVRIAFSPDGRYCIAALREHASVGPQGTDRESREWLNARAVVWDLRSGGPVALKDHFHVLTESAVAPLRRRAIRSRFFTFVAPDRLLISDLLYAKNGRVNGELLEFPSGRLLSKPVLPAGAQSPATDPNFVIVRLTSRRTSDRPPRVAAVELHTGESILSDTPPLDVSGDHYVAETKPGFIGLYERGKGLQAAIDVHQR